jgi:hypothetical protein
MLEPSPRLRVKASGSLAIAPRVVDRRETRQAVSGLEMLTGLGADLQRVSVVQQRFVEMPAILQQRGESAEVADVVDTVGCYGLQVLQGDLVQTSCPRIVSDSTHQSSERSASMGHPFAFRFHVDEDGERFLVQLPGLFVVAQHLVHDAQILEALGDVSVPAPVDLDGASVTGDGRRKVAQSEMTVGQVVDAIRERRSRRFGLTLANLQRLLQVEECAMRLPGLVQRDTQIHRTLRDQQMAAPEDLLTYLERAGEQVDGLDESRLVVKRERQATVAFGQGEIRRDLLSQLDRSFLELDRGGAPERSGVEERFCHRVELVRELRGVLR